MSRGHVRRRGVTETELRADALVGRGRRITPALHESLNSTRRATVMEIYTDATANGLKVSIGLEELGLEYKVHRVFLGGEQMTPEFTG
jgi:hypothetical protein